MPLMVFPVLRESLQVLCTSPQSAPVMLYESSRLAEVSPLTQKGNGGVVENAAEITAAEGVLCDSGFVVDYSQCEIDEKGEVNLRKLVEDFDDVFSKSQYDFGRCPVMAPTSRTVIEVLDASRPLGVPLRPREN